MVEIPVELACPKCHRTIEKLNSRNTNADAYIRAVREGRCPYCGADFGRQVKRGQFSIIVRPIG